MKINIKIYHFIFAIWLLLVVLRISAVVDYIGLYFNYLIFLFNDFKSAINVLDFQLADVFFSLKLMIVIPILLLIFRKRSSVLNTNLNFTYAVIVLLLFAFLLSPLVANKNPDFQKNLNVTKLLSPISAIKVLHLKDRSIPSQTDAENFLQQKNRVMEQSFNEKIILIDGISKTDSDKITYTQKGIQKDIDLQSLKTENGLHVITSRFYLLGSDEFGRDLYTRLVYGSRISVLVGLGSVIISLLIGLSMGFVSGYRGGIIDTIFNRLSELFLSFPVIYLVLLMLALFSSSVFTVIIVLGISGWMSLFKVVRSEVISLKNKDFIITAKQIGLESKQILIKEIFPIILIPVIVNLIFQFSNVILAESALSYLGLGTGNNLPSWGGMIQSGQEYITKAWWMILFPGIILVATLFSANNAAKKLNNFFNPRISE